MSAPQTIHAVAARLEATKIELGELIVALEAIEETRAAGIRDVAALEAYVSWQKRENRGKDER